MKSEIGSDANVVVDSDVNVVVDDDANVVVDGVGVAAVVFYSDVIDVKNSSFQILKELKFF